MNCYWLEEKKKQGKAYIDLLLSSRDNTSKVGYFDRGRKRILSTTKEKTDYNIIFIKKKKNVLTILAEK